MKAYESGGMSLSIKDETDVDTILRLLRLELEHLVESGQVEVFYSVSLYFQARKDNKRCLFYIDTNGAQNPINKAFLKQTSTTSILKDGGVQSTSTQQWTAFIEHQKKLQQQKQEAEEVARFDQRQSAEMEKKFITAQIARLKRSVCMELDIDPRLLGDHVSSFGALVQEKAIRRYIGDTRDMPPTPCFRVTYKNPQNGTPGEVYLFDRNLKPLVTMGSKLRVPEQRIGYTTG